MVGSLGGWSEEVVSKSVTQGRLKLVIGTRDRKLSSTCHNVQSSLSIPFKFCLYYVTCQSDLSICPIRPWQIKSASALYNPYWRILVQLYFVFSATSIFQSNVWPVMKIGLTLTPNCTIHAGRQVWLAGSKTKNTQELQGS